MADDSFHLGGLRSEINYEFLQVLKMPCCETEMQREQD